MILGDVSGWLLHVDLFMEVTVEECGSNIHLMHE
jgi:hypothetical protein